MRSCCKKRVRGELVSGEVPPMPRFSSSPTATCRILLSPALGARPLALPCKPVCALVTAFSWDDSSACRRYAATNDTEYSPEQNSNSNTRNTSDSVTNQKSNRCSFYAMVPQYNIPHAVCGDEQEKE